MTYTWKITRKGARQKAPTNFDADPDNELEQGPFVIQGKKASVLEWRVWKSLLRWGVAEEDIGFQVNFLGGRNFSGGQVLDFVIVTVPVQTVIYVNGEAFHASAAQMDVDMFAQADLERVMNGQVEVHVLWGKDLQTQDASDAAIRDIL